MEISICNMVESQGSVWLLIYLSTCDRWIIKYVFKVCTVNHKEDLIHECTIILHQMHVAALGYCDVNNNKNILLTEASWIMHKCYDTDMICINVWAAELRLASIMCRQISILARKDDLGIFVCWLFHTFRNCWFYISHVCSTQSEFNTWKNIAK